MDPKKSNKNCADQKHINTSIIKKMLAATLQYSLDILTVIIFLRGTYTGEYMDTKKTIKVLTESKCNEQVVKDLKRLLKGGCPNKINTFSSHKTSLTSYDMEIFLL